jgi:hypothetical protein
MARRRRSNKLDTAASSSRISSLDIHFTLTESVDFFNWASQLRIQLMPSEADLSTHSHISVPSCEGLIAAKEMQSRRGFTRIGGLRLVGLSRLSAVESAIWFNGSVRGVR